jgi:trehalose 6-phosphate synthase
MQPRRVRLIGSSDHPDTTRLARFVVKGSSMGKLILVSNREPFLIKRGPNGSVQTQRQSAGLVGALEPAMAARGGHWISWSGFEREAPKQGEALPDKVEVMLGGKECTVRRIPLTEREASLYYYGFACRTLWPLMHLHLGRVSFDAEAWRAYKRVNQRFADAISEVVEPGDRVWIHDFHLALVPPLLKMARHDAQIGFSWHIPWAPADAVRALPWYREIMEGVLAADQIGFALPRYTRHFFDAAEDLCGAAVERAGAAGERAGAAGLVTMNGRTTRVGTFPVGCDFLAWESRARAARGGRAVRLKRNMMAERMALSVDRLDQMRGVFERLRSIERFFDRYPSWRGRMVFCQIAVPSRTRVEEYRDMKREVDTVVDRINARFAQGAWQPIRYLYRSFDSDDLSVYYAAADVALVTPLADGLSFVPSEYLASRTREDGSLILSTTAGAADAFPEATLVNPYDEEAVAGVLHAALEMRPDEQRIRMRALRERARLHDTRRWLATFWQSTWDEQLEIPEVDPSMAAVPREMAARMEVTAPI